MHYTSWHVLAQRGIGCEKSLGNWMGELNRETWHPIKCYKHSHMHRLCDKSPFELTPSWRKSWSRASFDGALITTRSASVMSEPFLRWMMVMLMMEYMQDTNSSSEWQLINRMGLFCCETAHGHLSVQSLFLFLMCVQTAGPGNLGTCWLGTTN